MLILMIECACVAILTAEVLYFLFKEDDDE